MVLLVACLLMAPQSVPSYRILAAAGVGQTPITPVPLAAPQPAATWMTPASPSTLSVTGGPNMPVYSPYAPPANARLTVSATPVFFPTAVMPDITSKLRAFNAVATMIIGLLGCLLGVAAYRRAKTPAAA